MNIGLSRLFTPGKGDVTPVQNNDIEVIGDDLDEVAGGWCIGFSCTTYQTQKPSVAEAEG